MKTRIVFLFILFVVLACSQNDNIISNNAPDKNGTSTYSDFQKYLKADMDYNAITAKFGLPSQDVGSGIHIYVYPLADSTEVWIGYANRIIYARHVDKNRVVLDTII
jgi:hypothetical protein